MVSRIDTGNGEDRPLRIPQQEAPQPQAASAIAARLQQALAHHQRGELAPAELLYRAILAQQPNHVDTLHLLGVLEAQRRNLTAAVELISRAIAIDSANPAFYSNLGRALQDLKRHEEALASYDRALAIKPDYVEALNNRANALQELKRHEEALGDYDRALAIKPDYVEALSNRGVALQNLKRHEEALAIYDRALAIKPDHVAVLNNRSNVLKDLKRHEEALASYDRALAIKPDYVEALNNRGNVLKDLKRHEEALASYDRALAIKPDNAEVLNNRGNALKDLKRYEEALASYDRALAIRPVYAEALYNRGNALKDLKRYEEALASYDRALAVSPERAEVLSNRGVILQNLKRHEEALASYDRALALKADDAEVLYSRGNALRSLKRHEEALASYDRALAIRPDHVEAHYNRGVALQNLKRHAEALASYERVLAIKPDHAEALNNRGNVLQDLRRHEEALASYDRALAIKPQYVEALYNRGVALHNLKRLEEALTLYERALTIKPDHAEALYNRGNALKDLKRHGEALASYDRALAIKPDYAEALNNRGNALRDVKRYEEALASYDRALAIQPDYAGVLHNRGTALLEMRRHEHAAESFERLLEVAPGFDYAPGNLLHARLHGCNWSQYAQNVERIVQAVGEEKKADTPLPFLAVSPSAALQLRCARIWAGDKYPPSVTPMRASGRYAHERIRLAYVSDDFREHAVSFLMAGLLEKHARQRFETIAISLRPEDNTPTGQRVKAAFGRFVDVSRRSDREVAALMGELEVDIAVDLMGFTAGSRTAIFAHRGAPIQVNYLGFPATMGAEYIDYIIADRFVIPEDQRACYAEKVVYLPDSFQANDDRKKIGENTRTRPELGLPEAGFVFCSFNNSYKINPPFFDIWMRLLGAVPGSVLWLVGGNVPVQNNLRIEAAKRGIEPRRLIFAPIIDYAGHLARFRLADLFLDSLPFNAGTTASDALWAGVPVLTCAGEAFASRMGGSLLHAAGLPELITHSLGEYEALALKLAATPAMLAGLRARLAANRPTCPLFDTNRFRRHIESAYATMWQRHQRGEPPESFAVQPIRRVMGD